jgi:aryl-alcohol dehydrogenase-like predicted oxidoreductase
MRAIGASNWTAERFEAFNAAAARHGAPPFSVLSNQLSLAEMREPVWEGCLRADPAWHERTQTPLLAWSAQARGFFAGGPDDRDELRRSWLAPANLERRRQAEELAAGLGVPPVAVALAWLLARPFPTYAVVGPRDRIELAACLAAVDVQLPPDTLRRLETGEYAVSG